MDLKSFPFDWNSVDVIFRTASDYLTRNEEVSGALPTGETYELKWEVNAQEVEQRLKVRWSGAVHEWQLLGISTALEKKEEGVPYTPHTVSVTFHLVRQFEYCACRCATSKWNALRAPSPRCTQTRCLRPVNWAMRFACC